MSGDKLINFLSINYISTKGVFTKHVVLPLQIMTKLPKLICQIFKLKIAKSTHNAKNT